MAILLAVAALACTNVEDETPLEIQQVEGDRWPVLDVDPCLLGDCDEEPAPPPPFNLSLAFEVYKVDGKGKETGTISIGINRTLPEDLHVELNYFGRVPSANPPYIPSPPYEKLFPRQIIYTIPAGSRLSSTVDISPSDYKVCGKEFEVLLRIVAVNYGDDNRHVDPSIYTFISDPNGEASQVLAYPEFVSCQDTKPDHLKFIDKKINSFE